VYAVVGDRKLFTGYFLSLLWDSPLVVTVHAYELYNNPNPAMFVTALAHCQSVLTVTEHNRDVLVEKWKVSPEKIRVVRVSVDTELFSQGQRFVILIAGSVGYIKGHATLFEAVSLLQDRDVEVWVVGGPATAHPQDARSLARTYGVESQCVFLGWQSEAAVAALMRRADVLCAPSRQDPSGNLEGFPTVLAEAMFLGLPVITTRHSEIPAVVSATVVSEDSPSELAAAISRYKSSTAARAEDAAKNQDIAARLFGGAATELLNAELEAVCADARTRREVPERDLDAR
jgi:glycosyltransferase involved in cell wall biosynthesis